MVASSDKEIIRRGFFVSCIAVAISFFAAITHTVQWNWVDVALLCYLTTCIFTARDVFSLHCHGMVHTRAYVYACAHIRVTKSAQSAMGS